MSGQAAGGFLGSVVLFAVGFIAQNTINLVDNGRRQFRKDLCVRTRANQNPTNKTGLAFGGGWVTIFQTPLACPASSRHASSRSISCLCCFCVPEGLGQRGSLPGV